MKKRIFLKKKIGALALALLVTPLAGVPVAQAADIFIEGGGGGGGGGNNGTMAAGGGGNGGFIGSPDGQNDLAGTGASAGISAGGAGGDGGNADLLKDGVNGGVGGTGNNPWYTDTTSGTVDDGRNQDGGNGGNGGNADATTTDMTQAGVGADDTVNIHGGNGGNGGSGHDNGDNTGYVGGNGGYGGDASLTWDEGGVSHTITGLQVVAGANGHGETGWFKESLDDQGLPVFDPQDSSGGQGGSAAFDHTGYLEVTSDVNVQADGNSATFKNTGDLTVGGDTTVTATDSPASMTVIGNADLNTLTVDSTGGFGGDATFESNDLTAGTTTVKSEGGAGSADMLVHGHADLTTLSVLSTGSGSAGFRSTTLETNDITVQTSSAGNASMTVDNEVISHGNVTVETTGSGNASMTVNGTGSSVKSGVAMTIKATGSGNASFTANNADTVEILGTTGESLLVQSSGSGGGKASFEAPNANVHIASGELKVDSSGTTNANGTAIFHSKALNLGGLTTIHSGAALARATVDDAQLSIGNLTVTAGGNSASFEAPNATTFFMTIVNVNGDSDTGGDAKIIAENAAINTQNFGVDISTEYATGGTKGIYAKSLATGTATVTMTGKGSGDSSAQLVLSDFLRTPELDLTGINTPESVVTNINKVDVTSGDTKFKFTETVASTDKGTSGVYFKTISLGSANAVRILTATDTFLGSYWADTLEVYVHSDSSLSQRWDGDIWVGGSPGTYGVLGSATGTVGKVNMILPAGVNLLDYKGDGSGDNPNYMLKVSGDVHLSDMTTADKVGIVLTPASGETPFAALTKGDQLQLVQSTGNDGIDDMRTAPSNMVVKSASGDYVFDLAPSSDNKSLLADYLLGDDSITKAYLEGNVAALGNLYQGSELISRTMRNTFDPHAQGDLFKDGNGLGIMFGAEYSHQRLNAGSHVSSDYYNMVIGPAMRAKTGIGQLGLSVFFETGHGNFDTHNAFMFSNVVGDGNTDYYGGGIALRNDFAYGIYADITLRAGTVSTDLNLRDRFGAKYDEDTTYMGGHVALGKIFDFGRNGRADIYGGLLWTRLDGFNATLDSGDRIEFDAVDSLRSQLGGRYHYNFNENISGYAGAAWEYEFNGDVGGTFNGKRIDEPSLGGSTGKGELGVSINPVKNLSIDLGVQGYTGKREGLGGTATLTFTF